MKFAHGSHETNFIPMVKEGALSRILFAFDARGLFGANRSHQIKER
jgi:hypothetical protein